MPPFIERAIRAYPNLAPIRNRPDLWPQIKDSPNIDTLASQISSALRTAITAPAPAPTGLPPQGQFTDANGQVWSYQIVQNQGLWQLQATDNKPNGQQYFLVLPNDWQGWSPDQLTQWYATQVPFSPPAPPGSPFEPPPGTTPPPTPIPTPRPAPGPGPGPPVEIEPPPGVAPAPSPAPTPEPLPAPTPEGGGQPPFPDDAFAIIQGILQRYGLSELAEWARGKLTQGASRAQIEVELWEQAPFRRRFAGIFEFMKNFPTMTPPSPEEIINFEQNARSLMRAAGLPVGFYDQPEDFIKFVGGGVSLSELGARVNEGLVEALRAPIEVRTELQRLYDVGVGGLAAYFMDPDRALPVLQRQFHAARIGASGIRGGFGFLTPEEAEGIAARGVSEQQAAGVFGQLTAGRELYGALPGFEASERAISREEQLSAGFAEDFFSQELIRRRAQQRRAQVEVGGGFAAGREGLAGLGTAAR